MTYFKYMRLLFTQKLSWLLAKLKLAAQAKKVIYTIKSYQKQFGFFFVHKYFKLYDTMVKLILTKGAQILGTEYSDEIEQVQVQYCKDCLGVNKSVNDIIVLGECSRSF